MSKELYIKAYLQRFFAGDESKVTKWMNSPNRNFGNAVPQELINNGRVDKVYNFIKAVEEGY